MSATQRRSGPGAEKSRFNRSATGRAWSSRRVGPAEPPPGDALDARGLHEAGHPVAAHAVALAVDQLGGDPTVAVGLAGLAVHILDLLGQHPVGEGLGKEAGGASRSSRWWRHPVLGT
jgi:hypothetical protein